MLTFNLLYDLECNNVVFKMTWFGDMSLKVFCDSKILLTSLHCAKQRNVYLFHT